MTDYEKSPAKSPTDESDNTGHEISKSSDGVIGQAKEEVSTEKAVLVAPKPIREELVQNAVNFLKHPKVISSSDVQRRSFLEKKGLTKNEIDEAFRSLSLDTASMAANAEHTFANQGTSIDPCRIPQQENANGTNNIGHSVTPKSAPESVEPSMPLHPKSYMEIIKMLHRGEMPSDIMEINDTPPNPDQPISKPRMAPRPKPWEKQDQQDTSSNFASQSSGPEDLKQSEVQVDKSNLRTRSVDTSEPWWRKNTPKTRESEHHPVELNNLSSGTGGDESSNQGNVGPQPPAAVENSPVFCDGGEERKVEVSQLVNGPGSSSTAGLVQSTDGISEQDTGTGV